MCVRAGLCRGWVWVWVMVFGVSKGVLGVFGKERVVRGLGVAGVCKCRILSDHNGPAITTGIILSSVAYNFTVTPSNTSANVFRTRRGHSNSGLECVNGNIGSTIRDVGNRVTQALVLDRAIGRHGVSRLVVGLSNARGGSHLNTGTVLTMSLTITGTITGSGGVPLCHCLNNVGTRLLPQPVLGVLGNNTRTTGGVSVRRFVVVPCATGDFDRNVERYIRVCRALNGVLGRGNGTAKMKSRNNFTPSLRSSRRTVSLVMGTVGRTKCDRGSVGVTLSITSDR